MANKTLKSIIEEFEEKFKALPAKDVEFGYVVGDVEEMASFVKQQITDLMGELREELEKNTWCDEEGFNVSVSIEVINEKINEVLG